MADELPTVGGLYEIPSFAWLIKSGNKTYLYAGPNYPEQVRKALDRVNALPENAGHRTRIKNIVK